MSSTKQGPPELLADLDRPDAWMLLIDGIPQSHVDLGDPRHLELEYMRRLGHVVDLAGPAGTPLRVLHLGGGGLTLARYVAATRPESRQVAVEGDPGVAALVRSRLPLRTSGIEVQVADARAALPHFPAESFDVVVADVFAGGQTPAHLTSAEFTAEAARVLAPGGRYVVNISDGPPLAHTRGRAAAIRELFPHVCLIAEPAVLAGRAFGNLVMVASDRETHFAGLASLVAADQVAARLLDGPALREFIGAVAPITDASPEPSPPPPSEAAV
ncbi:MAG TPA: fused MFS/spermidine synthase [Streptosporangiaceae bacterium]